jgi:putative salt-induced outer membrane protein YdiY
MAFLLLDPGSIIQAQVDTEAMRESSIEEGWKTTLSLNALAQQGNTEVLFFDTKLRFDYRAAKLHIFFCASLQYGDESEERFINEGFMHLRWVRSLDSRFTVEVFVQNEFDDSILLEKRRLLGGGLRTLILEANKIILHMGNGFMIEHEDYTDPAEEDKRLLRSTNYLTGEWWLDDRIQIYLTTYFQPNVESISDYRVLLSNGLEFKLTDLLYANIKLGYRFDSEPLRGIKKYDIETVNGLSLTF